jgi:predicted nucleic acid-binding protein
VTGPVLADTGPIVALLNREDRYHAWSREAFAQLDTPVVSCEAVLSEACFLLRKLRGGADAVLKLVERGVVTLPFRLDAECAPVRMLLARYAAVPMSLADACLVRLCEQLSGSTVLTLDRDFRIYRRHRRNVIPTWMPAEL